MRNNLFIFLLLNVFLIANTPTSVDFKNAIFVNGNGEGSNKTSQISLVVDINSINIVQFNVVGTSSTTIYKKNHLELINKITYGDENPIIAKIRGEKFILVFNLYDTNDTSPRDGLKIENSVLRDGSTGGATNADITINLTVEDKTMPILISASTMDYDSNGYIDNIKLTFSEKIKTNTNTNSGFSVSSNTVLGISISKGKGNGENNDSQNNDSTNLYLRLKKNISPDTGVMPNVSYSENSSNKLQDDNGNSISFINNFSVDDKAKPTIINVSALSVHNGADIVNVGFSEPILNPLEIRLTGKDISTGNGPSIVGALITYFNDDKNITIELNETTSSDVNHVGYISGPTVSINMHNNAQDKHKNKFAPNTKKTTSTIELEKIKPKLLSINKIGNKGYFTANFDEPMGEFDDHDIKIEYNGTLASDIPFPSIYSVVQSKNKKTATLKVVFLPQFTETETRTLTFIMKDSVKDLAGNSIDANKNNYSYVLAIDENPPDAISFTIDMNTKKITIDFNESIAIDTLRPEAILISRYNEGHINLSNNSKAIYINNFSDNTGKVIITLNDDINSLKSFLKDKTDFNISISSNSGITDLANNACSSKNIPLSSSVSIPFITDNIAPNLLSWDFNLDNKKIILNFDEPMKVENYNASDISISDSNTTTPKRLTFTNSNSSAKPILLDKSVEITLFSSQIISILNDSDIAKNINKTFLEINANSSLKDIRGNPVNALSAKSALRAKTYKANKNKVAKLFNLIPNTWNHISINRPTKVSDIMSSGKISHIYSYDNEVWTSSFDIIYPKVGYWIKAGEHNPNTLEIPSSSKAYIKGTKINDLTRIKSKTDGKFHLIGIENSLTYEEMYSFKSSGCKNVRIHHYVSTSSSSGWDKNNNVLKNSSLWVQCVK
jgi:hypothetical protein